MILCVIVWIIRCCGVDTLCCYVDKLIYSVDNYVKVLCLLCFVVWISLLCVCVLRTVLLFCLRVADSKVSL